MHQFLADSKYDSLTGPEHITCGGSHRWRGWPRIEFNKLWKSWNWDILESFHTIYQFLTEPGSKFFLSSINSTPSQRKWSTLAAFSFNSKVSGHHFQNVGANEPKCSLFIPLVSHTMMRGEAAGTVKALSGNLPNALEPLRTEECE